MRAKASVILVLLAVLPARGAADDASLHVGDTVTYQVSLPATETDLVRVSLGGSAPCRDGFDRSFSCIELDLTVDSTTPPPNDYHVEYPSLFSLDHAEMMSIGDGADGDRMYPRPSVLWWGNPLMQSPIIGGFPSSFDKIRAALVGGFLLPLRVRLGEAASTTLGGTAMMIDASPGSITATTGDFTYLLSMDAGSPFPIGITVTFRGQTLVTASKVNEHLGTEPIALGAWQPLDLPAVRPGMTLVPWGHTFGPGPSDLWYPLEEAESLAALHPRLLSRDALYPDRYRMLALMIENDVGLDDAPLAHRAAWEFWSASGSSQEIWSGAVERRGPAARRDVFADVPLPGGISFLSPGAFEFVPSRADLPPAIVPPSEGLSLARSRVAISDEGFVIAIIVMPYRGLQATPDAIVMGMQCGTGESWLWPDSSIVISAVNGQVLSERGTHVENCYRYG